MAAGADVTVADTAAAGTAAGEAPVPSQPAGEPIIDPA
jgi:hypothetical protein